MGRVKGHHQLLAATLMKEAFTSKNFHAKSRALIDRANGIIDGYQASGYDLSVRQLYYQLVSGNVIPNSAKSYTNLVNLIGDARLAGLIDWDAIVDRSRATEANSHWSSPKDIIATCAQQFRYDLWGNQPCYVEVVVEKQALEGVLVPVCGFLDIPFTASKGYCSLSTLYEMAQRYLAATDKDLYLLHLADHDSSGVDMTRDLESRLDTLLGPFGVCVNVQRLALNLDQVEAYGLPPNPAKVTDTRARGYIRQYGHDSWELDALPPEVIADLVREAVLSLRDPDLWDVAVAEQDQARRRLAALAETMA